MVNQICIKLLDLSDWLYGIRLSIITNMIEEQYLMLSLMTHLIFAFKIVTQRFNLQIPTHVKEYALEFE